MRHKKPLLAALAALALVAAAVGAATALAGGTRSTTSHRAAAATLSSAELRSLSHLSAPGTPFTLPANDIRTQRLVAAGYRDVFLLARSNGRNFFRFTTKSGHDCFGTGRAGAAWPVGVISCRTAAPYFPSATVPILDLSVVGADAGDQQLHFYRLQGFAADGVTQLNVLDPAGAVIDTVPVIDNVYTSGATTLPATAVAIEALDASGHVLARVPNG